MRYVCVFGVVLLVALVSTADASAFGRGAFVSRSRVVNVQRVQQVRVQAVKVQQVVQVQKVQQVVAVEKVRVAQVVTPYVQVSQVAAYPVYSSYVAPAAVAVAAPVYYGGSVGADVGRIERLERNVEKLTELQTQMLQLQLKK